MVSLSFSTKNIHIFTPQKQMVKEGQVLCYVEQLGGEVPIEVWVLTWKYLLVSVCAGWEE
jgi:hypothetical protein